MARWNAAPRKTEVAMVRIARGIAWSWVTSSTVVNRLGGVQLSGRTTPAENDELTTDAQADGIQHRCRLAEPEPALSSLSQREQRAILREKMGLPPSYDPRR